MRVGPAGVAAAAVFVVTRDSGGPPYIKHAPHGTVPGLVVLDGSSDRWEAAVVWDLYGSAPSKVVTFNYTLLDCERSGLVGYRLKQTPRKVDVALVTVSSGQCRPNTGHTESGQLLLAERLGERKLTWTWPEDVTIFMNG